MKKLGLVLATIMMCFLLPLSAVAKESPQTICNSNEWEVLRLVNEQRMAKNLQPVSTFNKLQSACDVRANEIIKFFSHTRPNGKNLLYCFV